MTARAPDAPGGAHPPPGVGRELIVTDGSQAGTQLAVDIRPGSASSSPAALASLHGKVWFSAFEAATGFEPYVSDGTPLGTVRLGDINPGNGNSTASDFPAVGTRTLFSATSNTAGNEVLVSDGTVLGTTLIDVYAGSLSSSPGLTGIGGDLVPHLYVLDMATLAVTEVTLPAALEWVGSPEFSPDEQTLAFAGSSLANTADLYLCPFMP